MEENEITSGEKRFEEKMSIWAEKHSVTQETVDDVSKKWSLDSAADFFADCLRHEIQTERSVQAQSLWKRNP